MIHEWLRIIVLYGVSKKRCLAPSRKESGNRIEPKLETFNSVGVSKVGKLDAANGKKESYLKLCSAWSRTSPCTPREIPRAHPTSPAAPQESEDSASSASSADVLKPERTTINWRSQQEDITNTLSITEAPNNEGWRLMFILTCSKVLEI